MIVDLNPMSGMMAVNLIAYCLENNIDSENCIKLSCALSAIPIPDMTWQIDIPENHLTFFMLKYS